MKLTKKLIQEIAGGDADISSRLLGEGYTLQLPSGGSMIVTPREFKQMRGGADLYEIAARLAVTMGWQNLIPSGGGIEHIAHVMLSGQNAGLPVEAGGTERFFGLIEDPPPVLPRPSGVFGSQELGWTVAHLRAARLLGWKYGEGLRIGSCWR
jgi:hypothetical protein